MHRLLTYFIGLLGVSLLISCASNKNVKLEEPAKMDKALNSTTGDKAEQVGVRGDNIVVQRRTYLEEEITRRKDKIEDLESNIYGESVKYPGGIWLGLQQCRKKIADPRLGGTGSPEPMEAWDKPSESMPELQFRVDAKNNVVAVNEEELGGRISNLVKTQNILERRYLDMKDRLDACENHYRNALLKHGLNPDDTAASGEWVEGPNGYKVWRMRRTPTNDPEELMKRKAQREQEGR